MVKTLPYLLTSMWSLVADYAAPVRCNVNRQDDELKVYHDQRFVKTMNEECNGGPFTTDFKFSIGSTNKKTLYCPNHSDYYDYNDIIKKNYHFVSLMFCADNVSCETEWVPITLVPDQEANVVMSTLTDMKKSASSDLVRISESTCPTCLSKFK